MNALWAFPAPYQGDFKKECVSPMVNVVNSSHKCYNIRVT